MELAGRLEKLERIVIDGNGRPALTERMLLVENTLAEFVEERRNKRSESLKTNLVFLAAILTFGIDIALKLWK